VGLDGAREDDEPLGDLAVGEARRKRLEDLAALQIRCRQPSENVQLDARASSYAAVVSARNSAKRAYVPSGAAGACTTTSAQSRSARASASGRMSERFAAA
jgi:hypothetical protein